MQTDELSNREWIAASIALGVFPQKCSAEEARQWVREKNGGQVFSDAADGRPQFPMAEELWACGADIETANFVARMLAEKGYRLLAPDAAPPEERDRMREALEWYAEQVAGCRKLGSEGDDARQALDHDGGKRAIRAINGVNDG